MPYYPGLPTVTINGAPCYELVKDYEEGIAGNGPEINKSYLCDWPDRYRVANGVLGLASVTGGRGGTLSFRGPMAHPESPNAFAMEVRIVGKGRPTAGPINVRFDAAQVTVRFAVPQYGILPEPSEQIDPATTFVYCTQEIDQAEESIEFPGIILNQNARKLNKSVALSFAHAILRITFHKMPYMPVNTIRYFNRVNDTTFLGIPRGLVKFKGSQTRRDYQSDGSVVQSVTNTYHYRPSPVRDQNFDWNHWPNPAATGAADLFAPLLLMGDTPIFAYEDLTQTFPNTGYLSGGGTTGGVGA